MTRALFSLQSFSFTVERERAFNIQAARAFISALYSTKFYIKAHPSLELELFELQAADHEKVLKNARAGSNRLSPAARRFLLRSFCWFLCSKVLEPF